MARRKSAMKVGEQWRDAARRHFDAFWPDNAQEEFVWATGPIRRSLPHFHVRRVAPAKPGEAWVYVTVGAAEATRDQGMEFFLMSPCETAMHVETLAMVANFHADPKYRLSVGRTIDIGRPWVEGSTADHFLVSQPYPFGPRLECCPVPVGHVQVAWLMPLTQREAEFARQNGAEALEDLLDRNEVIYTDPTRPSVV